MVGRQHQDHLQEPAGVVREAAPEPQQRHDAADADLLLEHVRDGHAGVEQLLASVVGDGRDEGGRFPDQAKLLGPGVVDRDLGRDGLGLGHDGAGVDQLPVDGPQRPRKLLERVRHVEARLAHRLVLGRRRLQGRVGERAGVTELDLGLEHARAGADGPGHDGLRDAAVLDGLDDAVLLDASDLAQEKQDLALGIGLVPQHVVDEGRSRVAIAADGDALVDPVRRVGDDVVQLVRHAAGLGDVSDGSLPVQLRGDDVVHHASRVADLEGAWLDTSYRGRSDDVDALLLGDVQDLPSTLRRGRGGKGARSANRPTPRELHRVCLRVPGHPRR